MEKGKMQTASLELCRELYELSGWGSGTDFTWIEIPTWNHKFPKPDNQVVYGHVCDTEHAKLIVPAYDLGYLLRKLPYGGFSLQRHPDPNGGWQAYLQDNLEKQYNLRRRIADVYADTPEDTVCRLVIALFKEGALTE